MMLFISQLPWSTKEAISTPSRSVNAGECNIRRIFRSFTAAVSSMLSGSTAYQNAGQGKQEDLLSY